VSARLHAGLREDLAYCLRPTHLRRTSRIALVVGTLLTLVNQGTLIVSGDATALTWLRCAANFLIPLVVSNLGLLGGRVRDLPPTSCEGEHP